MSKFLLPDLGEGLPDAEIVKWLVKEGDQITAGDDMVEMSTAKAVVEVPAPFTGTVTKLYGQPGDVIDTGNPLIEITGDGEEAPIEALAEDTPADTDEVAKEAAIEVAAPTSAGHEVFRLPDLGEGLPDAEIVQWLVQEGAEVTAGDTMVEMSTAKAVVEVPAPHSGIITRMHGGPGDVIKTGHPLVEFATGGGTAPKTSAVPEKSAKSADAATVVGAVMVGNTVEKESAVSGDGMKAGPAARALARKMKLDLSGLKGSGKDGEITLADVRAGAENPSASAAPVAATSAPLDLKIGPAARALADGLGLDLSLVTPTGARGTVSKRDVLVAARGMIAGNGGAVVPVVAPGTVMGAVMGAVPTAKGVKAMPKVRAYASQKGVDLSRVKGTGPIGNISIDDVNAALKGDFAVTTAAPSATYQLPPRTALVSGEPEKLIGPRRVMAQAMSKARDEVVKTSIFDEADIAAWVPGSDVTARIMRAIIAGCMIEPAVNAWYNSETGEKTTHKSVHLGVAVDSPRGLFVPVIQEAETKSGPELRAVLNTRRGAITDGSIKPADMSGATITLSNFGMIAGRFATPIVVPPEVAIIGIGGLFEKLVMDEKGIANHRMIPVSLTFDHRACTGGEAARFLGAMLADLRLPN